MESLKLNSNSPEQTQLLGNYLGELAQKADVFLLVGELGTGKTCLVQGIARGLDVKEYAFSPSFVILREYHGRLPLYHIDLYRLSGGNDVEEMGLEEYVYGKGVTAIEWAEKAAPLIPSKRFWIDIRWINPTRRRLTIKASGKRNEQVLETFRAEFEEFFS